MRNRLIAMSVTGDGIFFCSRSGLEWHRVSPRCSVRTILHSSSRSAALLLHVNRDYLPRRDILLLNFKTFSPISVAGPGLLIFLLLNVCAMIWKKELYCLMKRKHFYSSINGERGRLFAPPKNGEGWKNREIIQTLPSRHVHDRELCIIIQWHLNHWIGMALWQYIFFTIGILNKCPSIHFAALLFKIVVISLKSNEKEENLNVFVV